MLFIVVRRSFLTCNRAMLSFLACHLIASQPFPHFSFRCLLRNSPEDESLAGEACALAVLPIPFSSA